jgi:hypothetical protein
MKWTEQTEGVCNCRKKQTLIHENVVSSSYQFIYHSSIHYFFRKNIVLTFQSIFNLFIDNRYSHTSTAHEKIDACIRKMVGT